MPTGDVARACDHCGWPLPYSSEPPGVEPGPVERCDDLDQALRRVGKLSRQHGCRYYLFAAGTGYQLSPQKPPAPVLYVSARPWDRLGPDRPRDIPVH